MMVKERDSRKFFWNMALHNNGYKNSFSPAFSQYYGIIRNNIKFVWHYHFLKWIYIWKKKSWTLSVYNKTAKNCVWGWVVKWECFVQILTHVIEAHQKKLQEIQSQSTFPDGKDAPQAVRTRVWTRSRQEEMEEPEERELGKWGGI